jgi:hypothetical protein
MKKKTASFKFLIYNFMILIFLSCSSQVTNKNDLEKTGTLGLVKKKEISTYYNIFSKSNNWFVKDTSGKYIRKMNFDKNGFLKDATYLMRNYYYKQIFLQKNNHKISSIINTKYDEFTNKMISKFNYKGNSIIEIIYTVNGCKDSKLISTFDSKLSILTEEIFQYNCDFENKLIQHSEEISYFKPNGFLYKQETLDYLLNKKKIQEFEIIEKDAIGNPIKLLTFVDKKVFALSLIKYEYYN